MMFFGFLEFIDLFFQLSVGYVRGINLPMEKSLSFSLQPGFEYWIQQNKKLLLLIQFSLIVVLKSKCLL